MGHLCRSLREMISEPQQAFIDEFVDSNVGYIASTHRNVGTDNLTHPHCRNPVRYGCLVNGLAFDEHSPDNCSVSSNFSSGHSLVVRLS